MVDAANGAPLDAASVGYDARRILTDRDGRFTLADVPGGTVVHVRRLGYLEAHFAADELPEEIRLEPRPLTLESVAVEVRGTELLAAGTALNVARVDREAIAASGGTSLAESLDAAEGISLSRMGSWGSRPVLRGLSGERVAVLIDGNRVTRACTYGMDQGLATIDPATVERVEVLTGPGSTLYGSGNIGGVINVVTRQSDPARPFSGEVRANGSTGVPGGGLGVSLGLQGERFGVSASVDGADFDDYRAPNGDVAGSSYRQLTGDLKARWSPTEHHRIDVKGQLYAGRDIGWPMRGGAEIPEETRTSLSADWAWQRGGDLVDAVSARAFFQKLDHHMTMEMVMPGMNGMTMSSLTDGRSYSETSGGRVQLRLVPGAGTHVDVGAELNHILAEGTRWTERTMGMSDPTRTTFHTWPGVRIVDLGAFAQGETQLSSRLTISAGGRIDAIRRDADTGERVDDVVGSGNLGLRAELPMGFRLRASAGLGYRTPDAMELYGLGLKPDGFVYRGNPELAIERNLNTELGVGWSGSSLDVSATAFVNDLTDMVVPSLAGDSVAGRPVLEYGNLGEGRLVGVSGSLDATLPGAFRLRSNLTWTRGEDPRDGSALPLIPPLEGGLALRRDFAGALRWVEAEWTGATAQDRPAVDAGEIATAAWAITNLRAAVEVGGATLTLGVENLFDTLYRAHLDPRRLQRPGRNLFMRVTRSF